MVIFSSQNLRFFVDSQHIINVVKKLVIKTILTILCFWPIANNWDKNLDLGLSPSNHAKHFLKI